MEPTIGELLGLYANDPDAAWDLLWRESIAISSRVQCQPEDVAQEAVIRAFQDNAKALLRAREETSVCAWLRGVQLRIEREFRRARIRLMSQVEDGVKVRAAKRPSWLSGMHLDRERRLTRKQRDALGLYRQGMSISAIARVLGISRSSARERIGRGLLSLKDTAKDGRIGRKWATGVCRHMPKGCSPQTVLMVRLRARGHTHVEIGSRLGVSAEAVRSRLRRLERFLRCHADRCARDPRTIG